MRRSVGVIKHQTSRSPTKLQSNRRRSIGVVKHQTSRSPIKLQRSRRRSVDVVKHQTSRSSTKLQRIAGFVARFSSSWLGLSAQTFIEKYVSSLQTIENSASFDWRR